MSIAISVIVPVYNVEKWLRECLDSVCGQSLRNIEIVCINDGSPDHSLEIMKEYAARDDRFLIIDKQNEGVGAARNDGIRAAHGEFVAFMDPDDKYPDSDTLRLLYNAAKEHDVLIAGGYYEYMDELGHPVLCERSYCGIDFTCAGIVHYKDYQCDLQYTAFVFSRSLLFDNDIVFPQYRRFQDPPFFVRAMAKAEIFYALNRVTYSYRVGAGKRGFAPQTAIDVMTGIGDNLRFSKEMGYSRLHYLSVMHLLSDATYLIETMRENDAYADLIWKYIKTSGLIDEGLLREGGYALPEPALPKLFVELISESDKYRALMKYKSIRAFKKLIAKI